MIGIGDVPVLAELCVAEPFCGAGGLALGLARAGFRNVWAADRDRYAAETFRAAIGDCVVDAVTGDEELGVEPGQLDLLAGGVPCQPFSHAGARLGQRDPRDGFPVFLRLAERYLPRAIMVENVAGLLSGRHRPYLEAVLDALRRFGYHVDYRPLQAADYGVPQRRQRVFIVGLRDEAAFRRWRWPEQTHSLEALVKRKYLDGGQDEATATRYEAAALRVLRAPEPRQATAAWAAWNAAQRAATRLPWVTVREALGDLVQDFVPGKTTHTPPVPGHLDTELVDTGRRGLYAGDGARAKSLLYKLTRPDAPADTVSAAAEQKGSEHCARVALYVRGSREWGSYHVDTPICTVHHYDKGDVPKLVVRNLGAGDGCGAGPDDVAPTVSARVAGQSGLAVMDAGVLREYVGSEGTTEPGRVHRRPGVMVRRLSHAEVARLQAFPDDWPWRGPSTSVYRQIGNAVPPPLAEVVGRAVARALRQS